MPETLWIMLWTIGLDLTASQSAGRQVNGHFSLRSAISMGIPGSVTVKHWLGWWRSGCQDQGVHTKVPVSGAGKVNEDLEKANR